MVNADRPSRTAASPTSPPFRFVDRVRSGRAPGMVARREQPIRIAALFFAMMASGGNLLVPREVWVILTLVATLVALRGRFSFGSSRTLITVWILAVTLLQLILTGMTDILSVLSRLTTFISALLLLELYLSRGVETLKSDLFAILKIMAIQAILTAILGNLTPSLFAQLDINGIVYHHLGYVFNFHYVHNIATPLIRPNGLFYEPGIFQFYLALFLYLCLFWRLHFIWSAVGLVALLTTFSTIGLMISLLLLFSAFFVYGRKLSGLKLIAAFTVLLVSLPVVTLITVENANEKLFGSARSSSIARQYDFFTGLNLIREHPLTGIGFSSDAYLSQNSVFGYSNTELTRKDSDIRSNSNGLMQMFYSIGIPLALPLFFALFRQTLFQHRIIVSAFLFLSLLGQSLTFSVFFLFIMFSGMLLNLTTFPTSGRGIRR